MASGEEEGAGEYIKPIWSQIEWIAAVEGLRELKKGETIRFLSSIETDVMSASSSAVFCDEFDVLRGGFVIIGVHVENAAIRTGADCRFPAQSYVISKGLIGHRAIC